jgi:hypothetical protein
MQTNNDEQEFGDERLNYDPAFLNGPQIGPSAQRTKYKNKPRLVSRFKGLSDMFVILSEGSAFQVLAIRR